MTIKDLNEQDILTDEKFNSRFFSVKNRLLQVECKILRDNFYLESFNYFPITDDGFTFKKVFFWGDEKKYNIFYKKKFNANFESRKDSFKKYSNSFILGSSANDNYYTNLLVFLPRIFFLDSKETNIVLHRNSSNDYREFILKIFKQLKIKIKKIVYLDDDYYKFTNSEIPQFLSLPVSIKIINSQFRKKKKNNELKIYISRQNSSYRNLINEDDITKILKNKGFEIIDTYNMSIAEQIELFSSAKIVISPTSSALTNLVFCKENTKVIEITPQYNHQYENFFKEKYSKICEVLNLNYSCIAADPIKNTKNNSQAEKFISSDVLQESNYYKDLLLQKSNFEEIVSKY